VTPSPNARHQTTCTNLTGILWLWLNEHRIGTVLVAPFDVVLSELDVVQPDLIYISRERNSTLTEQHVRGAPDLVIEIVSPGTRRADEITKRKLYERFGVAEHWVVDPELETIKIYRRREERFARAAELTVERRDWLSTPLLPGFSLALEAVGGPF